MTGQAPTAEARLPEDAPDVATPGPAPREDREAMLADQMAACHRVVLDCLARGERAGGAEAARHGELRLAARFMTLFLRQNGALDRHQDHARRARAAEEQAGRDRLNRQVNLAAAQGRGLAEGFEASLRRFEQAERARTAAAPFDDDFAAPAADDPARPVAEAAGTRAESAPADFAPYPAADDLEGWTETFAAPQRRAEAPSAAAPPPKLTRQQRRAAKRAQEKAARTAMAAKAG